MQSNSNMDIDMDTTEKPVRAIKPIVRVNRLKLLRVFESEENMRVVFKLSQEFNVHTLYQPRDAAAVVRKITKENNLHYKFDDLMVHFPGSRLEIVILAALAMHLGAPMWDEHMYLADFCMEGAGLSLMANQQMTAAIGKYAREGGTPWDFEGSMYVKMNSAELMERIFAEQTRYKELLAAKSTVEPAAEGSDEWDVDDVIIYGTDNKEESSDGEVDQPSPMAGYFREDGAFVGAQSRKRDRSDSEEAAEGSRKKLRFFNH